MEKGRRLPEWCGFTKRRFVGGRRKNGPPGRWLEVSGVLEKPLTPKLQRCGSAPPARRGSDHEALEQERSLHQQQGPIRFPELEKLTVAMQRCATVAQDWTQSHSVKFHLDDHYLDFDAAAASRAAVAGVRLRRLSQEHQGKHES